MSLGDILDPHAESIPVLKLGLHALQLLLAFVGWCLAVSVFRADGAAVNSNNGWTFAVFFLSVPAWIFLVLTPRFPRTARFASPKAMLVVDATCTLLWLSAFASQAVYNTSGSCGSACNLSEAIVGLGVFIFLLFCATTLLSAYTATYHDWNGRLPGYGTIQAGRAHGAISSTTAGPADPADPDKAAFSMAPHLHDDDDDDDGENHHLDVPYTEPYSTVGSRRSQLSQTSYVGGGGFAPLGHEDTAYGGAAHYGRQHAYDVEAGPVVFPVAEYDRARRGA